MDISMNFSSLVLPAILGALIGHLVVRVILRRSRAVSAPKGMIVNSIPITRSMIENDRYQPNILQVKDIENAVDNHIMKSDNHIMKSLTAAPPARDL